MTLRRQVGGSAGDAAKATVAKEARKLQDMLGKLHATATPLCGDDSHRHTLCGDDSHRHAPRR